MEKQTPTNKHGSIATKHKDEHKGADMSDHIKEATFIYVLDDGSEMLTLCKFNTATKEAFDIEARPTRSIDDLFKANDYVVCNGITYKAYSLEVLMGDSVSGNMCWYK